MNKLFYCFLLTMILILFAALTAQAWYLTGYLAYKLGQYETAFDEFKPLAESGDVKAQSFLGIMYLYGQGVEKDYPKAYEWLNRSSQMANGHAQYHLGNMYVQGWGVERDYKKAYGLYKKSADKDIVQAQNNLG